MKVRVGGGSMAVKRKGVLLGNLETFGTDVAVAFRSLG
jgi:hypothetical protein